MKLISQLLVVVAVLSVPSVGEATPCIAAWQQAKAKSSPFEMVRWNGESPEVRVEGAWWKLESIDGVSCEKILTLARREHGDRWAKRFCEDLVELMTALGRAPAEHVTLELRELESNELRTLERVAMSAENRERIRLAEPRPAGLEEERGAPRASRVSRERSTDVAPQFEPLTRRLELFEARGPRLTHAQAQADLEQLEWLVANLFSYCDRTQLDWRAAFDALHARLGESISVASFQLQIHGLLTLFGDGHSRLKLSTSQLLLPGVLPIRCARDARGVIALDAAGAPLDPKRPYLRAIDGEPLESWLELARGLGARGSAAFEDRTALRRVVQLAHLRALRGVPASKQATLSLSGATGAARDHQLELGEREVRATRPPRLEARKLDGGVGWLRIGAMDDDARFLTQLDGHLDELAGVRGLVIDVRGNGGGTRDVLLRIAPRIFPKGPDARVVNVAALRLAPGEDPLAASAALADRFLHPREWDGWSPAARAAVDELAERFEPSWSPPSGEFGPWCYLVLERDQSKPPLTEGPVAVLIDGDCFSATDVFAGALGEFGNVTLVGAPTGGGSGRARGYELEHSRISLQLSSMISYLPSGQLYDGAGVQPDVSVEATLDDVLGRTDSALEKAAAIARKR